MLRINKEYSPRKGIKHSRKTKSSAFLLQILSNFQECARGQGKFDIEWNETCVADGACTRSCYL